MSEQNYEPEVMLSWTNDGGHTWEGYETASLGKQGEYDTEVRFNRLGSSGIHGRCYRIQFSAGTKFSLLGATADVDVLGA
jgi:hypothetical protein